MESYLYFDVSNGPALINLTKLLDDSKTFFAHKGTLYIRTCNSNSAPPRQEDLCSKQLGSFNQSVQKFDPRNSRHFINSIKALKDWEFNFSFLGTNLDFKLEV